MQAAFRRIPRLVPAPALLLRFGAAIVAALPLGCSYDFVATDRRLFHAEWWDDAAVLQAEEQGVTASGAYDLGCPSDRVSLKKLPHIPHAAYDEYLADGCGQRASYKVICEKRGVCRAFLIARVSLEPARLEAQ